MSIGCMAIIGGSRGIGAALIDAFAERGVDTLSAARSVGRDGLHRHSIVLDVAHGSDAAPVLEWLSKRRGPRLAILAAASLGPIGSIDEIDIDEFMDALNVNVGGAARFIKTLAGSLTVNDRIVVFLGGGVGGPNLQERVPAYVASKFAIAGLVEAIGRDPSTVAPIVAVSPGMFRTELTRHFWDSDNEASSKASPERADREAPTLDVTRLANLLEFLCTDAGASFRGRILSSNRDNVVALAEDCALAPDLLTLRRVDGVAVRVGDDW